MVERHLCFADHLAHNKTRMHIRDPFYTGYLIQQKCLIPFHVRYPDAQLIIGLLPRDEQTFDDLREVCHGFFKLFKALGCVAVHIYVNNRREL